MEQHKGADGLRSLVGEVEQGVFYLFSNWTRALLKFFLVNSTGAFYGTRRFRHSRFDWPESPAGRQKLTADELVFLLIGGGVKKLRFKKILAAIRPCGCIGIHRMLTLEEQSRRVEKLEVEVSGLSSGNRYLMRQLEVLKGKFFG